MYNKFCLQPLASRVDTVLLVSRYRSNFEGFIDPLDNMFPHITHKGLGACELLKKTLFYIRVNILLSFFLFLVSSCLSVITSARSFLTSSTSEEGCLTLMLKNKNYLNLLQVRKLCFMKFLSYFLFFFPECSCDLVASLPWPSIGLRPSDWGPLY